jgi:hypothetical protein
MIPKNEDDSIVWTNEMAIAYGAAHPLLRDDPIAARMAFKEKYTSLLREARLNGVPPKWSLTGGYNKAGREAALKIAVDKNQISIDSAKSIMPEIEFKPQTQSPALLSASKKDIEYNNRMNKLDNQSELIKAQDALALINQTMKGIE